MHAAWSCGFDYTLWTTRLDDVAVIASFLLFLFHHSKLTCPQFDCRYEINIHLPKVAKAKKKKTCIKFKITQHSFTLDWRPNLNCLHRIAPHHRISSHSENKVRCQGYPELHTFRVLYIKFRKCTHTKKIIFNWNKLSWKHFGRDEQIKKKKRSQYSKNKHKYFCALGKKLVTNLPAISDRENGKSHIDRFAEKKIETKFFNNIGFVISWATKRKSDLLHRSTNNTERNQPHKKKKRVVYVCVWML